MGVELSSKQTNSKHAEDKSIICGRETVGLSAAKGGGGECEDVWGCMRGQAWTETTVEVGPLSGTFLRQTDSDVTRGQCSVSDRNLVPAVLIRHSALSDGEVCLSVPIATVCFVSLSHHSEYCRSGP